MNSKVTLANTGQVEKCRILQALKQWQTSQIRLYKNIILNKTCNSDIYEIHSKGFSITHTRTMDNDRSQNLTLSTGELKFVKSTL